MNLGQVWLIAAEQDVLRGRLRTGTLSLLSHSRGQNHKDSLDVAKDTNMKNCNHFAVTTLRAPKLQQLGRRDVLSGSQVGPGSFLPLPAVKISFLSEYLSQLVDKGQASSNGNSPQSVSNQQPA